MLLIRHCGVLKPSISYPDPDIARERGRARTARQPGTPTGRQSPDPQPPPESCGTRPHLNWSISRPSSFCRSPRIVAMGPMFHRGVQFGVQSRIGPRLASRHLEGARLRLSYSAAHCASGYGLASLNIETWAAQAKKYEPGETPNRPRQHGEPNTGSVVTATETLGQRICLVCRVCPARSSRCRSVRPSGHGGRWVVHGGSRRSQWVLNLVR
jgi:hypothetical protein